jgi:hypothetical protein
VVRHIIATSFLLVFALAEASSLSAQTIDWSSFDPMAIRTTRTSPAALQLQTSGVAGVRLDLAAGGAITLTSGGSGRFTTSVPASALLFDYHSDDVNHHFVGFLRLLDGGGAVLATYNLFIGVIDDRVPQPVVQNLPNNARRTARILNILRPAAGQDIVSITNDFYRYFPDRFDFIDVVFSLPSFFQNRYHFAVKNEVTGIGQPILHNGAAYGSAGKLLGISVFPLDTLFDAAETAFSHELGHQWINFTKNPLLQPGPHWPLSTMAHGVMGFNIPGSNVGGDFPFLIQQQAGGTYQFVSDPKTREFDDFDLYLMGLMTPAEVSPGLVLSNQSQTPCHQCPVQGSVITFHIEQLIASDGTRLPAASWPRSFHAATVVVTRDRLLTDDEMAYFEYFAARGESRDPLPFTSGFERGTTKPLYLATRDRATIDLQLDPPPVRRRAVRH